MDKGLIVFSTCPDRQTASDIASRLIEERLAACIQIHPAATSVYRWQGKIVTENEYLLTIKTSPSTYPALEDRIRRLHPYELPEIIAVDISYGSADYLRWIEECTCKN